MAAGRSRRDWGKERFWREVVGAQAGSGLSVREFCRRRQVAESAFYFWRRALRQRDAQSAALQEQREGASLQEHREEASPQEHREEASLQERRGRARTADTTEAARTAEASDARASSARASSARASSARASSASGGEVFVPVAPGRVSRSRSARATGEGVNHAAAVEGMASNRAAAEGMASNRAAVEMVLPSGAVLRWSGGEVAAAVEWIVRLEARLC